MLPVFSPEYAKRIRQSIQETEVSLLREKSYSFDLQKPAVIKFYENHIARLERMLITGWEMPTGGRAQTLEEIKEYLQRKDNLTNQIIRAMDIKAYERDLEKRARALLEREPELA